MTRPPDSNDWRRTGQEKYLMGVQLHLTQYFASSESSDHDHCEFCWAKFSTAPDDLHQGYATPDKSRWVCQPCFKDFKHEFQWAEGNVGP